uniref:uncharacterized protein LOC128931658 n=1 Tax=Callithrix jacchus TaxID=9483 RepID=UPI0023DCEC0F|nr:uncharacterized protein LOC128931658 [Callithrix jacchus]
MEDQWSSDSVLSAIEMGTRPRLVPAPSVESVSLHRLPSSFVPGPPLRLSILKTKVHKRIRVTAPCDILFFPLLPTPLPGGSVHGAYRGRGKQEGSGAASLPRTENSPRPAQRLTLPCLSGESRPPGSRARSRLLPPGSWAVRRGAGRRGVSAAVRPAWGLRDNEPFCLKAGTQRRKETSLRLRERPAETPASPAGGRPGLRGSGRRVTGTPLRLRPSRRQHLPWEVSVADTAGAFSGSCRRLHPRRCGSREAPVAFRKHNAERPMESLCHPGWREMA